MVPTFALVRRLTLGSNLGTLKTIEGCLKTCRQVLQNDEKQEVKHHGYSRKKGVERFRNAKVGSSILLRSTNKIRDLGASA